MIYRFILAFRPLPCQQIRSLKWHGDSLWNKRVAHMPHIMFHCRSANDGTYKVAGSALIGMPGLECVVDSSVLIGLDCEHCEIDHRKVAANRIGMTECIHVLGMQHDLIHWTRDGDAKPHPLVYDSHSLSKKVIALVARYSSESIAAVNQVLHVESAKGSEKSIPLLYEPTRLTRKKCVSGYAENPTLALALIEIRFKRGHGSFGSSESQNCLEKSRALIILQIA